MNIYINGEQQALKEQSSLAIALQTYLTPAQQKLGFAVAVNSNFVSKSHYPDTILQADDSVDVLFPIHGG